jgi:hypothetical protein
MGRGIVKLADNKYVEWSSVVDAPVSYVFTKNDASSRTEVSRIERANSNGHSYLDSPPGDYIGFNRAGPYESCITKEAILRRYESEESYKSFKLTPKDIQPYTNWDEGKTYWVPWKPGNEPKKEFLEPSDLRGREEMVD